MQEQGMKEGEGSSKWVRVMRKFFRSSPDGERRMAVAGPWSHAHQVVLRQGCNSGLFACADVI